VNYQTHLDVFYARLNWQLACQFSSAYHLSYRMVSYFSV